MPWYISPNVNNGYPALDTWRESWQTGWTSNDSHRYPDYVWRCKQGVNNGYPWIYPWFKEDSYDSGEMVIGGSQSNYPNGFSNSDLGGIRDDFDSINMITDGVNTGGIVGITQLILGLSGKAFVVSGSILNNILSSFNDDTIFDTVARGIISQFYGANIFDCFVSAKTFPFDIASLSAGSVQTPYSVISSTMSNIKAFGQFDLGIQAPQLASTIGRYIFPVIEVRPLQAWEIESIDFSIYLPYSGTYTLDIRGDSDVSIILFVDLLTGSGVYHIYINGQLVMINRAMIGCDFPVNNNQGRTQDNMISNVISTFARGLGAAIGGVAEGTAKSAMINGTTGIGGMLSGVMPHYAMTSPSIGSTCEMLSYPFPRIIAKIPKMFNSGYGYKETLGWNRSTTYVKLSECSGFTKCKNYKTDIIVATSEEKAEIERLMNSGVFM